MTNLQVEHLVERWEDRRDVKNQMGKFMHYLLLKKEAAIVDDLWSSREDICPGLPMPSTPIPATALSCARKPGFRCATMTFG